MTNLLKEKMLDLVALCKKTVGDGGNIVITGHDNPDADSVISSVMMQGLLWRAGVDAEIKLPTPPDNVTTRDMQTLGIWDDSLVCPFDDGDLLLLVDHHKSFYKNRVIACVDHHTTPPAPECETAIVIKASSCGKIIYDMMRACEIASDEDELLALYSVYLDTQSCRSSKFNREDAPWAEKCIEKYSLDREALELMGFCLNSSDTAVDELATYAYKRYELGGKPSASSCLQIDAKDEKWQSVIASVIEHISDKMKKEGYAAWALVINKPIEKRSDIYWIYQNGNVEKIELDRLASRSRDVIPCVSSLK